MIATPTHASAAESQQRKRLGAGFIITVSSFVALCSKRTSRAAKKIKNKVSAVNFGADHQEKRRSVTDDGGARKLFSSVSNKAMTFVHLRNHKKGFNGVEEEEEEFGDGSGVWQREILMGDKCQPLDFSGVIYYDGNGKQLHELPLRSPRASPMPGYLMKSNFD
jgi:hypothetical protein